MSGGVNERHLDNQPFASGTHTGSLASKNLWVPGADFKSCGVQVGSLIKNITKDRSGPITNVTEDVIEADLGAGGVVPFIDADGEFAYDKDGEQIFVQPEDDDLAAVYWSLGDEYEIYITDTEDSLISANWTDRRYGRNYPRRKLYAGLVGNDMDKDEFIRPRSGPR